MEYTLRPYQQEAVDTGVRFLNWNARKNGIQVLPTGSGKSLVIANTVRALEGRTVVFQPSKEILEQNRDKFRSYGIEPAIYSASFNRRQSGEVTLATIGSVVKRPEDFADVKRILIDECRREADPD